MRGCRGATTRLPPYFVVSRRFCPMFLSSTVNEFDEGEHADESAREHAGRAPPLKCED